MKTYRQVVLGLLVTVLASGTLALAQTSVSVTKTKPVQPSQPTPTEDWKQWCDGQVAAARASQEGYANWRESLGLPPEVQPLAQATGVTAATVQATGSTKVWPQPAPQQSVHDLVAALVKQAGIYVVLPDPTLTFDAERNLFIVCPEGTVYSGAAAVTPTPH